MAFLNFTRKREELPSDIELDMPPEPPKSMREDVSTEEPIDEELMHLNKSGPEEEELPELPPLPDIEEPEEWGKGLELPLPFEKKKKWERTTGKSPVLYIIIFVLVAGIAYSILNYKAYYAKAWNFILELFTRFPFLNETKIYLSSNYLTVIGAVLLIIILVTILLIVRSAKKKGGFAQKRGEGLPELPPLPEEEVPEMPEIPEEGAEFPEIPPFPEETEVPLPEVGEEEIPRPIEPLRPVAERMIPSTRVTRPLEKAVKKQRFITIDEFRQIRGDISSTRGILKKASSFFSKLERVKGSEDKGYAELCNSLQDIQEKIVFINKTLFKE